MATLSRSPAAVAVLSKPMAVLSSFINNGRFVKIEDQASGRNGRFIKQKRPNAWIRAADCRFRIAPCKEFISGQAEPFFIKGWQSDWPFYQGRPAALAVLSKAM